jgi:choline dehydrogenase-like flavoprotein
LISDLRDRPADRPIEADVCIVGAGPAGISLAMQFATTKWRVCVLEAGGMQVEPQGQQLYEVENTGQIPVAGTASRLRMFGGTSNHWDGRCAPLDRVEFTARSWVPHSGWPITLKDLEPHYSQAAILCDLGQFSSQASVLEKLHAPATALDEAKLDPQLWQMSTPTRFAQKYGTTLRVSENVEVVLHAGVVGVSLRPDGTLAQHVDVSTPEGRRHEVRARFFVLACGGIENPRILLLSDAVQKTGIGNQRDLVGRFFMQHFRFSETLVMEADPYALSRIYARHETASGSYVVGLRLSDRLQSAAKVLNGAAFTYPEGDGDPDSGRNSTSRLLHELQEGGAPRHLARELFNIASDFSDVAVNIRQRFLSPGAEPYSRSLRQLVLESEQAPNPQSRIRLGTEVDALGARRVVADWRVTQLDLLSCQQLVLAVASELSRLYKARISMPAWLGDSLNWEANFRDVAHHLGTTRMATSEQYGVVDANCAVFGVPNLFMAGGSVFSTAGHANPTLTIVALAVRLAGHLKAKLA